MSSANVITPTAPDFDVASQQAPQLYPTLPLLPDGFRLQKINEIAQTLKQEINHYRLVAKKYKRAKTVLHYTAVSAGAVSGLLSTAGITSALTGVGIIASVPLGAVAAFSGITAAALTGACKKLEPKLAKHHEIAMLAMAKHETVNRLVSKALTDNHISDPEFQLILNELDSYFGLKETVRRKVKPLSEKKISPPPDLVKIREQIRLEEKDKLKKRLSAVSTSDLKK